MRVAVFGGSFNPPHVSHVLAVAYVLATSDVDRVLVVPAFDHPLGKSLVPFEHRMAMCRLAFADIARVELSSLEAEQRESRTFFTLKGLRERHPDWSLRLVVGGDILLETHKWFAWDEVVAMAPLIVLGRAGFSAEGAPAAALPEVSSRDVRARLAKGEDMSALVPRSVLAYAREHGLYAPRGDRGAP